MNTPNWLRQHSGNFWTGVGVLALVFGIIMAGILLSWCFWEQLHGPEGAIAPTIRSVVLVIAAPVALTLAVWRSIVASLQSNTGQRQAEIAERGFLNERYQKGAEMLGSEVLSVRMGGVYALQRLAEEHPVQYHIQIISLFCAFTRNPTKDRDFVPTIREDVRAVLKAILDRGKNEIEPENHDQVELDLTGSDLRSANLRDADLAGATLTSANLTGAILVRANLAEADLRKADLSNVNFGDACLSNADLTGAKLADARLNQTKLLRAFLTEADLSNAMVVRSNLSGADLADANLSGVHILQATGLSQKELDRARADTNNPPILVECIDSETGQALVWRDHPLRKNL